MSTQAPTEHGYGSIVMKFAVLYWPNCGAQKRNPQQQRDDVLAKHCRYGDVKGKLSVIQYCCDSLSNPMHDDT